jgi:hypothetical protein
LEQPALPTTATQFPASAVLPLAIETRLPLLPDGPDVVALGEAVVALALGAGFVAALCCVVDPPLTAAVNGAVADETVADAAAPTGAVVVVTVPVTLPSGPSARADPGAASPESAASRLPASTPPSQRRIRLRFTS